MAVQNNLISAWRDSAGIVNVCTATNQSPSWSSSTSLNQACQGQPSVTLLNWSYYLAYSAPSTGNLMICSSVRSTAGTMAWSKPVSIGQSAAPGTSPALATFVQS